jgi:hypothetical protein
VYWWDFLFSRRQMWKFLSSWILRREFWQRLTDVSQVFTASVMRTMVMEAVSTSETSVNFYWTTWHTNSEHRHLHICILSSLTPVFQTAYFHFLAKRAWWHSYWSWCYWRAKKHRRLLKILESELVDTLVQISRFRIAVASVTASHHSSLFRVCSYGYSIWANIN